MYFHPPEPSYEYLQPLWKNRFLKILNFCDFYSFLGLFYCIFEQIHLKLAFLRVICKIRTYIVTYFVAYHILWLKNYCLRVYILGQQVLPSCCTMLRAADISKLPYVFWTIRYCRTLFAYVCCPQHWATTRQHLLTKYVYP